MDEVEGILARIGEIEGRLSSTEAGLHKVTALLDPALAYPEPIATPVALEHASHLYHEKFLSLLDAGESCIKYTAAIALSLVTAGTVELGSWARERLQQPQSIGTWAGYVREALPKLDRVKTAFGFRLLDSLRRDDGKPTPAARYLLDEFVHVRNQERGHGAMRPEGVIQELYSRHCTTLHDSLADLSYLEFPLVRVESVNVAMPKMLYDVRVLTGPSPMGRMARAVSEAQVSRGSTCVWDRSEGLLNLGGLVAYRLCTMCGLEHTFFLERVRGETRQYHSYSGNHRMTEG